MKVYHGIETLEPPLSQCVLTVGNFDGVHRAHQQLIAQAGLFAANTGGPVVVLTFEPHPLSVVRAAQAPPRLSLPEQKLGYLADAGADITVVARSEPALLGMEPEDFVETVLVRRLHPTHMVEGPSFGFGRGRRGNAELLQRLGQRHGFQVHVVEPVTVQVDQGETVMVSSSLIRRLLEQGKVHRAALCLGRPYTLMGTVSSGARRGRKLGFPTANVDVTEQLLPGDGVYAGRVVVGDRPYRAAVSIGTRVTFGPGQRQLEAYLLDFQGDLYGQVLGVELHRWLREQRRFESPPELVEQLQRDAAEVRAEPDWSASAGRLHHPEGT
ncbi:MAG TPA: bifunctional riboflavin kinase/FAD synthetase [Phycisphaerae bacterium]|nr:bifunctional riboflavin kinase/FAD synthetase [Phycisphaerae bacterium]HNU45908.1 bifunctional riboflavin kinase/FAD synthetase [Phycisphaerae bacterium]